MQEQTAIGGASPSPRLRRILERANVRQMTLFRISVALSAIIGLVTIYVLFGIYGNQHQTNQIGLEFQQCQQAVSQMQAASDMLTNEARQFVADGERIHLDNYLAEATTVDKRGSALRTLRNLDAAEEAVQLLTEADSLSHRLEQVELYALRLECEARRLQDIPKTLQAVKLEEADAQLPAPQQHKLAEEMLNDRSYMEQKIAIDNHAQECAQLLSSLLGERIEESNDRLEVLLMAVCSCIVLFMVTIAFLIGSTWLLLLHPMELHESRILQDEPLDELGSRELRRISTAYNQMYEKNQSRTSSLSHEAQHDPLTGAFNRGAFESLLNLHKESCALLLVDIDFFKQFNDTYGHEMGDAILVEVVATLFGFFRSSDYICRIGGDEFAVIMGGFQRHQRDVIATKLEKIREFLRDTENGLPEATLSIGIAYGDMGADDSELFKVADAALYEAKRRGRDCYVFADEYEAICN